MKLLFFSSQFPTPANHHGAAFNRSMVRGLAMRHDVRVVCPIPWTTGFRRASPSDESPERYEARFQRYYFIPRMAMQLRGVFMWWSLRHTLLDMAHTRRPDVVLSYWAHPDGEAALRFGRHIGAPVALVVGGSDVLVLTADQRRKKRIDAVLHGVDQVIAIGEHLRQQVVAMGVPPDRVTSILRSVDCSMFSPGDRWSARDRCGIARDHTVLLCVGRLVPVKGVEVLLEAVARLRLLIPNLLVCIAGTGPLAPRLEKIAVKSGIASMVRWLGTVRQADLPDWYRAADLTVLPSYSEGVPNVLLESVACGTPFVASRVGSIPYIADDACDRLVSPGRSDEIAAAVVDLLERRARPENRRHALTTEAEFQSRLDAVLERCVQPSESRADADRPLP